MIVVVAVTDAAVVLEEEAVNLVALIQINVQTDFLVAIQGGIEPTHSFTAGRTEHATTLLQTVRTHFQATKPRLRLIIV